MLLSDEVLDRGEDYVFHFVDEIFIRITVSWFLICKHACSQGQKSATLWTSSSYILILGGIDQELWYAPSK